MTTTKLARLLGRPVVSVQRRPSLHQTSFRLEEIEVELDDGARLELLRKDVCRDALGAAVRGVKPAFVHDPSREAEVYALLSECGLGTPTCYAAGPGFVLIERVHGVELFQVGELDVWRRTARWLRRLHERFAAQPPEASRLLRHDAAYYRLWAERARGRGGEIARIVDRYEPVVARLLSLPRTLIHGEFYPSNVLIAGDRIAPVDWETAAVGPGLIDLAALVTGWEGDERSAIATAYGTVDESALAACRLHLALQWLGWSTAWEPPPEHAYDWEAEAVDAANRLGL